MSETQVRPKSLLAITAATEADDAQLIVLWERCGLTRSWNDPKTDIARARQGPASDILIGREAGKIVASIMVGHDGHRGSVYYVSVDPDHRKKGYGRAIMEAAEEWLRAHGIDKLNLMVRAGNTQAQAFYETLDYDEQERVVYAKWLDGREPTP